MEAAAEHAAREGVALRLATGSMTSLPYADGEFDAVVCLWSAFWELLEEREQLSALAEMWRVLALGGLALVEGPLPEEEPGQIDWLVIEGLQNPHFVHDAPGLLRLSEAAGIRGGAVMERDWAGRTRLFLELRR